jgi:antitoxin component of RelBE/YafQ-DinJ toxin-antitoxin module
MQLDVAQIKDDKEVEQVIREKFLPFDIQIMVFPQENFEDLVGMHLKRIASMRSLPIFNCFSDQLLNLESIYVLLQSRTTGYDISLEPGDEGYDSEIDQLLKKCEKSFNSCVDLSENFQAAQKAQK